MVVCNQTTPMNIAIFPATRPEATSVSGTLRRKQIARCSLTLFAALLLMPLATPHAAGSMTYLVDPVAGDDANPAGKPWKTFGRLNSIRLVAGDTVLISPGIQEESLKPSGEGTAENPVVIKFLPGVHTFDIKNVTRKQLFISNSIDSTEPIPIGIMLSQVKHFHVQGGGVDGAGKTTLLYDGRMMQILNENSEDIEYSGLAIDMKRTAVSEIRVLEAQDATVVIQVAEASDYQIENGRFLWRGDWLGGVLLTQQLDLKTGVCGRRGKLRGWTSEGQTEARATDLGNRKVKLEFPDGTSGLMAGHQYHFRNGSRVMCGVHSTRSARITFRDCEVNALPCMGFVSQFTDTMTFQRVNVVPPVNTIRTCSAWADIFQFSNCKGDILVESCRLSGMQDDALNCHGTYLRVVGKEGDRQLLVRYVHPQTYGFAPYAAGDEVAVMNANTMREHPGNPRAQVGEVKRVTDKDWLITLNGPMPDFQENDVIDNITWNPNITARNNHISVNPVRGFLLGTRGKVIIENNIFDRCRMPGILVEGDAAKWFESSPIRDLLIRGNRFIGCGIHISSTVREPKPDEPVHENIRIINNTFDNGGISATAVRSLVIMENQSVNSPLKVEVHPSCSEVKTE
jgi:Right handed beta helix region